MNSMFPTKKRMEDEDWQTAFRERKIPEEKWNMLVIEVCGSIHTYMRCLWSISFGYGLGGSTHVCGGWVCGS